MEVRMTAGGLDNVDVVVRYLAEILGSLIIYCMRHKIDYACT